MESGEQGNLALKLLVVPAIVAINAFFVAAELAFMRVRATQLEALVARGNRRAIVARRMVEKLDSVVGSTQLGITLAGLGMGALVEPVFHQLLLPLFDLLGVTSQPIRHGFTFAFGFIVNTFLLVALGELAPKAVALRQPQVVALWCAWPLLLFQRMAQPVIWMMQSTARGLLRLCGLDVSPHSGEAHSEEELRLLVSAAQAHHGVSTFSREITLSALDLRRRLVREVMRPRREITVLNLNAPLEACLEVADRTRYSRFPLCPNGNLDQCLGVVHIKDLYALRQRGQTGADLLPVSRKLIYVPASARLERLLQLFQERRLHLALVVDEFGGTIGLVTLENILEELVGQIQDEFDQEKPLSQRRDDHTWELDGALPLHELVELVGEPLGDGDDNTVSGWVTRALGGFPSTGAILPIGRFELTVDALDGPKVSRLTLREKPPATPV